MKIDDATLAILGPCKEGFEWVEIATAYPLGLNVEDGDALITAQGVKWDACATNIINSRGIAIGTGKFYRQVPIEPEPEVIWGPHMNNFAEYRILVDGTLQVNHGDKWQGVEKTGHAGVKIADDFASQHAALKKAREQLREIKAAAEYLDPYLHEKDGFNGAASLIALVNRTEAE